MFSRRNRGFIGTCFILIAIVLFGYGLYMYDLKSVKLTESEAQRHHLQRSEKKINEKLDKIKGEKKTLESELENTKIELSKQTKSLEIELEQRQLRENEAHELGKKLQAEKDNRRECDETKDKLDHMLTEKDVALVDFKTQLKTANELHTTCQASLDSLTKEKIQIKSELDALIDEKSTEDEELTKEKNALEVAEAELKQYKSELMELRVALGRLGVKGIKRDEKWVKLTEDDRGIILRGVLDSDIYPNEFLEQEIAPTPENKPQVDEPVVEKETETEKKSETEEKEEDKEAEKEAEKEQEKENETAEENVEEQAVPPNVQKDDQPDESLDSKEEAVDDEDVQSIDVDPEQ